MGKSHLLLDSSPKHVSSFSLAYSQARPWAPIRTAVLRGLFVFLAVWLCATASSLLLPPATGTKQPAAQDLYVLMIDSGSSGTRIYAYSWTLPDIAKPGSLPIVRAIPPAVAAHLIPKKQKAGLYRVETQPGLDAFLGNPAGLSADALGPLLAWARAAVPAAQHASTPLFLMGTGGLRRMEQKAADQLMQDITKHLKQSGFRFHDSWARVITGTQEGIYGWLALNYQQQLLQQQVQSETPSTSSSSHPIFSTIGLGGQHGADITHSQPHNTLESLGALDLGGSSLEMTFEVDQQLATVGGMQNVTLADKTFYLHTYTFKHYGLNEAFDKAVTLLLEKHHGTQQQQQQQKEQQRDAEQPPQQLQQRVSVGGAVTTETGGSAARLEGYGDHMISSIANASQTVDQQHQADLAAAAAAGLQIQPNDPMSETATRFMGSTGSDSLANNLLAEQHRQADLAVAAAAGLHPRPSAAAVDAHQVQGDATIAVITGALAAVQQQRPAFQPAADGNEGNTGDQASDGNVTEYSISRAVIMPGIHQASQHDSKASSVASRAAATQSTQAAAVAAKAPSSGSSSSLRAGHIVLTTLTRSEAQPVNRALLLAARTAEEHKVPSNTGGLRGRQGLLQHSRQQRRRQRHLLLQQHAAGLLGSELGLSSLAPKMQEPIVPQGLEPPVRHIWQQHEGQLAGAHDLHPVAQQQQLHTAEAQGSVGMLVSLRQLSARDVPADDLPSGGKVQLDSDQQVGAASSVAIISEGAPAATPSGGIGPDAGSSTKVRQPSAAAAAADSPGAPAPLGSTAVMGLPVVEHPCLHQGYEQFYERIAFQGVQPQPAKVLLRGISNWSSCLRLVEAVVNATAPCNATPQRPVCMLGSAQPQLQGRFSALTGFYVVKKFLGVPANASLDAILDASQDLCSRPWSWVQQKLGQQINAERYCTWGPYMVKLLKEGLLLKDSAVHVGSGDVGWPLGAALSEASRLPEMMCKERQLPGGVAAVALRVHNGQLGSTDGQDVGIVAGPAADYSQRSSLAQRLWGTHRRLHMGQVSVIFVCVMVWLSIVVYCLPSKHHSASAGVSGPWSIPGHGKSPGRAFMSPVLPVAGYHRGRSSPNNMRNGLKH